ncbi:cytochrome P450 [Mycena pura]|uniref:Cytochrome P450 n=1 Tax=Mycena pura TaxID=153505 RepID=A0AAD6UU80_9AGAR|nr:cytochrome P450 [Mycena pura]
MTSHARYLYAAASIGLVLFATTSRRKKLRLNHPPIINIPASEILNNPREAYEKALRERGPVIAVPRRGTLEFLVDETLIPALYTSDQTLSFEEAMASVLHLRPFVSMFWGFFREIDDLVQNGINPRLSNILERICPVFIRSADTALEHKTVDMFEHAHTTIAEAMTIVIFGEGYTHERNIKVVIDVATDIAGLTGMYQNSSFLGRRFPAIWSALMWIKVICTSVFAFFRIMGPQVWRHVRSRIWVAGEEKPTNVLEYLCYKYAKNGTVGFMTYLQFMSLLLGIIFASVHQTASVAVWVVFELALRPEYLQRIREEVHNNVDPVTNDLDPSTVGDAVQNAVWLDSFIREVMRTKGDTLSTCRRTTADVEFGGCTIPKGNVVSPLVTLAHLNPANHPDPTVFRPERWHGANARPAVMSSASYLAFGMGRWACPGRVLAVSEIKMIVWSIIVKATPHLVGNKYKIVDPLNTTSVPPEGELILKPFSFS